ncbi:MAG: pyridoxal phosphate-dependent aminotransferase [Desulfobacterales bacterium]|jgi:aspartate aminotransferase|nr:pyridoxal phosphate-dependent aminotransferase [Desulfobacterales bacterium]
MSIAKRIETVIAGSSWIRRMFEEGSELKKKYGAQNVFDFSLGNPNLPPPERFKTVLRELVDREGPDAHAYMPNTGYPDVCGAVAGHLATEQGVPVEPADVIMTCGAAGALNIAFKALLDPGDEVLTPVPCFVEYGFYAENHGGVLKTAPSRPDFQLDIEAIAAALTPKTKAVLINSPHNPTGAVYSAESLAALAECLARKSRDFNRTIYLISDEPYRKVVFDGTVVPSLFSAYPESLVATSYSKDLSIPGERIGFAAVNPRATHRKALVAGMALANRILGFVNAPALMQRAVARLQGESADIGAYQRKRDLLCAGLSAMGYEFVKPAGTFYLFPRSPIADDVQFAQALKAERVLVVPGSGFHAPGHFRIAFCVADAVIRSAMGGFENAMRKYAP